MRLIAVWRTSYGSMIFLDVPLSFDSTFNLHTIFVCHIVILQLFSITGSNVMMSACACETGGGVDDAAKDNKNRYH